MSIEAVDERKGKVALENGIETAGSTASVRATITFPSDLYATLEQIAKQKKVSLAWVVRDATEKYIADKWPLFAGPQGA